MSMVGYDTRSARPQHRAENVRPKGCSRENGAPPGKSKNSQLGRVKFFNRQKGFGFITPDGGGKDVFVGIAALQLCGLHTLDEGDRVRFKTEPSAASLAPRRGARKGQLAACNIRVVVD